MFNKLIFALLTTILFSFSSYALERRDSLLNDWRFHLGEAEGGESEFISDSSWTPVRIPHDWAITQPFSRTYDLQKVAVKQNGESVATWKTGRTGGLPWTGTGWYRTRFATPTGVKERGVRVHLLVDGAMSHSLVFLNGQRIGIWPYGYNSFYLDLTPYLKDDGSENLLAIRLHNPNESSRWYPGAGLFRRVHLVTTPRLYVPIWGTRVVTTPEGYGRWNVALTTSIAGTIGKKIIVETAIFDANGQVVANNKDFTSSANEGEEAELTQNITVERPHLWAPETPYLYSALSRLIENGVVVDTFRTVFGIRQVEVRRGEGFFLNGVKRKFRGVCLHHDLGPLGAAVHRDALRHQLLMLKAMGADAIRTAHNMPDPQQVELCDSLGLMVMVESFDEWTAAKCKNGYHCWFNETTMTPHAEYPMIWAQHDLRNMIRNFRNHPSVVMWSIGNEIPQQHSKDGIELAKAMQHFCHEQDATRPVTCGMDQVRTVISNGFAAALDVPGFNYRTQFYEAGYEALPQKFVLGSETASTVSSRGVYPRPLKLGKDVKREGHQSSGYDTEACSWSNVPDEDFRLQDDFPWTMGQFVWTGFDYLGEPSPYDTDDWPSHSSLFGIIDLASLPKDRFYLYQSQWQPSGTFHVLPHWTWHEGDTVPVMAYSQCPAARLYVNGKLHGEARKLSREESEALKGKDPLWLLRRYRLIWPEVPYEAGELKVEFLDEKGVSVHEETIRTAGAPSRLKLETSYYSPGDRLCYITVSMVDKKGTLCPDDASLVEFCVKGNGRFKAAANGDPTSLDPLQEPRMHLFSGQCTVIVETDGTGSFTLSASSGKQKGSLKVSANR